MRRGPTVIFGCTAALSVICLAPPVAAVTLGLGALIVRGISGWAQAAEAY